MKSFLAGLGLGFGLGMLFAPMRGEEAREMVAQRASEFADTARDQFEQVRDKAAGISAVLNREHKTGTDD